jgi:hypothetical protein
MREILKTAPAGTENTKQRKRERAMQQKIAALKKIEPSMVNYILADFLKEEKVIFSNSTGTATPTAIRRTTLLRRSSSLATTVSLSPLLALRYAFAYIEW